MQNTHIWISAPPPQLSTLLRPCGSIKCREFSSKVDIQGESETDDEVSETREETDESEKHAPPATVDITEGDFVMCEYAKESYSQGRWSRYIQKVHELSELSAGG